MQSIFSTVDGVQPQRHCCWKGTQEKRGSFMVSWVTGVAIQLDAAAPCNSGSHLGSDRAFLRSRLPSLARISCVGSVGTDPPSDREQRKNRDTPSWDLLIWARPHSSPQDRCCSHIWDLFCYTWLLHPVSIQSRVPPARLVNCWALTSMQVLFSATGMLIVAAPHCTSPTLSPYL